ncbi:hypothetical protein [Rhodococcus opacus]|uniref:hypothetical protein n=1 Tax=Rhodococcus opacus TaxID=37919 RepID=UPI00358E2505
MVGSIEFATDLFDRDTVERIAARYVRLLERVVADRLGRIDLFDILEPTERALMLRTWNETAVAIPEVTVPGLFERQVAATGCGGLDVRR